MTDDTILPASHYGGAFTASEMALLPPDVAWRTSAEVERFQQLMALFDPTWKPFGLVRSDDKMASAVAAIVNAETATADTGNLIAKIGMLEQSITEAGELHAGREQGWQEETNALQAQLTALNTKKNEALAVADRAAKMVEGQQALYNGLADEHHRLEIRMARHEGYIDRVRERDPRQGKGKKPKVIRAMEYFDRRNETRQGRDAMAPSDMYGTRGTAPWYRRKVE